MSEVTEYRIYLEDSSQGGWDCIDTRYNYDSALKYAKELKLSEPELKVQIIETGIIQVGIDEDGCAETEIVWEEEPEVIE